MNNKNINIVLQEIGDEVVEQWKSDLQSHIASGDLIKSIKYKIKNSILILEMNKSGIYIDQGTRPHMPPVKEITRWIVERGLKISPWGVAVNISKYGTQKHPFIYKYYDILKAYKKEMIKAGRTDITDLINKQLETQKTKHIKLTL